MKSFLVILISLALAQLHAKDKLTADEVIQKHLASIGSVEDRAAIHNTLMEGPVALEVVGSTRPPGTGVARLFSQGKQYRVSLSFDYADYYGEHFTADADKMFVGFSSPVTRSAMGDFLNTYNQILKEGLVGGTLTTAWALLDIAGRQPRLEYLGTRKVNGQQAHVIGYHMRKGQSELTIQLFFDAETFRHVRSLYSVEVQSIEGPITRTNGGRNVIHNDLEETFSDFKTLDGITIPAHWTIRFEQAGSRAPIQIWDIHAGKLGHNQPIDPKDFVITQPK